MKVRQKAQLIIYVITLLATTLIACNPSSSNDEDDSQFESATPIVPVNTDVTIATLTPMPVVNTPIVNVGDEETAASDYYSLLQTSVNQFSNLSSYQAKQEYRLLMNPLNTESGSSISIFSECGVNNLESSAHCETQVSIVNNGETTEINSEVVTVDGQYWFRRQGEDWQAISPVDARVPGLVNGKITPLPYIELVTEVQQGSESLSSEKVFDQIYFETDLGTFFEILFGPEEGQAFYQSGKEYDFTGYLLIGQEDNHIYEHSVFIEFLREDRQMQIQLTQSMSNFDEPITLPAISE